MCKVPKERHQPYQYLTLAKRCCMRDFERCQNQQPTYYSRHKRDKQTKTPNNAMGIIGRHEFVFVDDSYQK